ncbi:MAG: recombination regulator RecX [Oscillospiraceae bacterium]|nr:recombination regulator RecX [Oscillospiraceae bacterium]
MQKYKEAARAIDTAAAPAYNTYMHKKSTALDRALRALAMRAHSEQELVQKLTRAGHDEHEIAEAMAKLNRHELLDDRAFAADWAASRARRGLGAMRIAQELRQKRVDGEAVAEALAALDEDQLLESAVALARKHLARGDQNARRRAMDALHRRGFSYALSRRAIERAETEETP